MKAEESLETMRRKFPEVVKENQALRQELAVLRTEIKENRDMVAEANGQLMLVEQLQTENKRLSRIAEALAGVKVD